MPFRKGQSGNPGGRPKILADVRELARAHTDTALNALVEIVENKKLPPAARVAAANSLLDRGYGKPEAKIDASISAKLSSAVLSFAHRRMNGEKNMELNETTFKGLSHI